MSQTIHRAPWLATGSSGRYLPSLIEDGAVHIKDGYIKEVGPFHSIADSRCTIVDHDDSILSPGLINAHAHLELSWISAEPIKIPPSVGFIDWIRGLLEQRSLHPHEQKILDGATLAAQYMKDCGTAFLIDIGNDGASRKFKIPEGMHSLFLLELIGLAGASQHSALERLHALPDDIACTAHAPYSAGPTLLHETKKRAVKNKHLFSIHTAESKEEIEFLQSGTGPFASFLEERGVDTASFTIPASGAVNYLDSLGVLDQTTLCVHCVHLDFAEMDILAARGVKVCLCPGSNRYLGVGKAPLPELLRRDILPFLGTDSSASNAHLSIWEEMRILQNDWPEVDPEIIFSMAAGVDNLQSDSTFGSAAPFRKKSAQFLAVQSPGTIAKKDIFPFLTSIGTSAEIKWVKE